MLSDNLFARAAAAGQITTLLTLLKLKPFVCSRGAAENFFIYYYWLIV